MRNFILSIIAVAAIAASCNNRQTHILASQETLVDSLPGQCPFLTKDTKGNTVVSWVRMINDSTSAFCYAVSKDGKHFGSPVVIPNSGNIQPHGENMPKIVFKPGGEIIALWGAANPNPRNKYSGLVYYVQSFDEGKSWSQPRSITNDTASYDQRYYDVAMLPGGEAGIIWLDNRKTISGQGSAVYFAATEGKKGFGEGRRISQPCCPCCRTDLFVDRKGGIHVLYRGIIQDSIRDMVHIVSVDNGKTFSSPERISKDNWVLNSCPHTGPSMTENAGGLHFAWFTGGNKAGCFYTQSVDNGASFRSEDSVSSLGSHPQMTALANDNIVIVWDEYVPTNENKPYKRIGVQERDGKGASDGKIFITSDSSVCTYPVVGAVDAGSSIVAYTSLKGKKNYVAYQVVNFK